MSPAPEAVDLMIDLVRALAGHDEPKTEIETATRDAARTIVALLPPEQYARASTSGIPITKRKI